MKQEQILSCRKGPPAYFDMAARFRPPQVRSYGIFRIGDRAAAHIMVGDWRVSHPDHQLTVIEDDFADTVRYSRILTARWLFEGWVDQIWSTERLGETVPLPQGEAVCKYPYFEHWSRFRRDMTFIPSIKPDAGAVDRVREALSDMKVGPEFVTIQPLWDACYLRYRNELPVWWMEVVERLARDIPVVVLGLASNFIDVKCPAGAFPLYNLNWNIMESLAAMSLAKAHIGGETGTTLWAPIFGVPTLALYRCWFLPGARLDVCPISFGKPVVWGRLGSDAREIEEKAVVLAGGRVKESKAC